jgi:CheY-like chemotaxis protein
MNNNDRVKILIVDDIKANLLALRETLKNLDIEVISADSGNEALAHLLDHEFACIILDVKMPEMDGFELAKIIRTDERTKYVPIIFASANQQTESDIFKGYETGAVDYLMKPLNPAIVRSKVHIFAELLRKEDRGQVGRIRRRIATLECRIRSICVRRRPRFKSAAQNDARLCRSARRNGTTIYERGSARLACKNRRKLNPTIHYGGRSFDVLESRQTTHDR